jgi:hypothetical protein
MNSREKAAWLGKTIPYRQPYLRDAWRQGARAFWSGHTPDFIGNSRERAAFWKGYDAAETADNQQGERA